MGGRREGWGWGFFLWVINTKSSSVQNTQWKTDCRFHCRVPTSLHHQTTLGQVHWKRSNLGSEYLIHIDLRLENSPICMYSAEKWVIVPLWEWKQWQDGGSLFPLVIFFSQLEGKYFVRCYENECQYLWLVDIQSLYSLHLPYLGGLT